MNVDGINMVHRCWHLMLHRGLECSELATANLASDWPKRISNDFILFFWLDPSTDSNLSVVVFKSDFPCITHRCSGKPCARSRTSGYHCPAN